MELFDKNGKPLTFDEVISLLPLKTVSRVEIIDNQGRSYVNRYQHNKVSVSLQDDNRTLKIFITKDWDI
jgi:hypothetical protein